MRILGRIDSSTTSASANTSTSILTQPEHVCSGCVRMLVLALVLVLLHKHKHQCWY